MDKSLAQQSAEEQQENPLYVCSECGETVIIFNGRAFPNCSCDPATIIVTPEGVKRGI